MSTVFEILRSAIQDGAAVSIVYNGGSRPGQSRIVIPISVSADEVVARESTARVTKTFKLQKIALASLDTGEAATNLAALPAPPTPIRLAPDFETFEEYAAYFKETLKESGFGISEGEKYFAITGVFKNGKPRRTPTASIQYIDRTIETVFNFDSGELEEHRHELTGRERPWRVDSNQLKEGKSFSQLAKAAELFLQEVRTNTLSANDA